MDRPRIVDGRIDQRRPAVELRLVVPDSSPIIGPSPLPGLYLNCGWGTGGFKSIPAGGWLLAHLIANGTHHEISRPFDLDRFARGRLVDEAAGSGIAH